VILDMTGVTFVDTVGVSAVVNGAREFGNSRQLRVISPPDRVAAVFEDSGLGEVFELVPDRRLKHDRRQRDVPVEFDRRAGSDRRFPTGQESASDNGVDPIRNRA